MSEDDGKAPARSGAEVIPFRRPAVAVTPGSAAEAALDWLAERVTWRAPAEPAETVEDGDWAGLLEGAVSATHLRPVEDVLVVVRQFADGRQDVLSGRIDDSGTFVERRRTALGRGALLAKTDALRAVLAAAVEDR